MIKTLRRNLLLLLILPLWLTGYQVAFAEEDEAIEEVIVTGSYIRRDNFNLPSPIDVTTEEDLELAGTSDLGDVIFDQTFQYGVNANATPFEGGGADDQQWNQGQEVWANLRGLGTRATMTMTDGHRMLADTNTWGRRTGVDVNATYPGIAIGRIETILDGASALYGAEAVGGVINILPKKDFEGIEVQYDMTQALTNGAPTTNLSLLAGIQGERGGAIFAVEMRDQERMRFTDRPEYILTSADPWEANSFTTWWNDSGGRSNPAEWNVPQRNADGELVAQWAGPFPANLRGDHPGGHYVTGPLQQTVKLDPGCGHGFGTGHNDGGTLDPLTGQFNSPDMFGVVPEDWANAEDPDFRFENPMIINSAFQRPGNFLNGTIDRGDSVANRTSCRNTISEFQDMQADANHNKGMAYFEYEFNDYVTLRGELVFSVNDYNTRDVTGAFDEVDTTTFLGDFSPIVIGENPGNPYRAFADGRSDWDPANPYTASADGFLNWDDANGDRIYQYGVESGEPYVFAQDANGDGVPDRDFDGDGVADVGAQGEPGAIVLLMSLTDDADGDGIVDRFDHDTLGNGSVRLFEDVRARGGELNVHPKHPRNLNIDWAVTDGPMTGVHYLRRFVRDNTRMRLGAEIAIPNTEWIVDADYIYSTGRRVNFYPEPQLQSYVQALRCKAGTQGNSCWNPFSSQWLASTEDGQIIGDPTIHFPADNDPGWTPADHEDVNTELENRFAGVILNQNQQDLKMQIVDVIASNGSVFDLPWNDAPVGLAVGAHYRTEFEEWRPNSLNQLGIGGGKRALRTSEQQTEAFFAEISLPLMEDDNLGTLDVQLAARYSEITTRGIIGQSGESTFDTVIPKVAVRYSPFDMLAVRASLTEGFVTPGLFTLFGDDSNLANLETVYDYVCDNVPELEDCDNQLSGGAGGFSGQMPNVAVSSVANSGLGAETSDLYNIGLSLRLLEGDMVFDLDFTTVDFNGRAEQISAGSNIGANAVGFQDFLVSQCPGTVPDWDNPSPGTTAISDGTLSTLTIDEYIAQTSQAELDCRLQASINWVATGAKGGLGESGLGDTRLVRGGGPNGLTLSQVDEPWVEQGETTVETLIYSLRYNFDGEQIPVIGGDYGSFTVNVSVTQMLENSIQRYTSFGCDESQQNERGICPAIDNPAANIRIDGVGNENNTTFVGPFEDLYSPLPPTPEFRASVGLRWFNGNHTAQLSGNWHDSVTSLNVAWDEAAAAGLLSEAQADIPESERCRRSPSNICRIASRAYWNLSYTYNQPDFFGFNANVNVSIRNLFDTYPQPVQSSSGYVGYLDNILGRVGYVRVALSM